MYYTPTLTHLISGYFESMLLTECVQVYLFKFRILQIGVILERIGMSWAVIGTAKGEHFVWYFCRWVICSLAEHEAWNEISPDLT